MKFSEIWYVDASQQNKMLQKNLFLDFGLFWPFSNQKTAKIDQKWRKLAKYKPFDEILWNLVCRCFPTKKMLQFFFLNFGLFWPFFNQKTAKIDQKWWKLAKPKPFGEIFLNLVFAWLKSEEKWRKLAKSKPFDEIFWNLVCRCFPTKKILQKFFFWISAFLAVF